jgi:two-component system chemotaxis sensor kinase CheA
MDLSAFYNQFRDETAENVRALSDGLLAIEAETDEAARRGHIDRIFRAMHTVKGSARMLGFEPVGRLAHALESLLGELRQGRRELDRPLADALLRGGDTVLTLAVAAAEGRAADVDIDAAIAALPALAAAPAAPQPTPAPSPSPASLPSLAPTAAPAPPPSPSPSPAPARGPSRQTVRVRVDRLDRMLNLAGELTVGQQMLANHADEFQELYELTERQGRALADLEAELHRLRFSATQRQAIEQRLGVARGLTDEARALTQRQSARLERHVAQSDGLVKDLEQEVMAVRLLPISTVYAGLPRAARDLSQATGKPVRLELRGESVELDRKVLELLNDPLLHLVRNAVDHGIEAPAERERAGKPAQGLIEVSAEAVGSEVRVTVSDDGRGMEPARIRERAVRLGLIGADVAARLSDAEALELSFVPGFSTAPSVTEISGRGVGMDVVRANLAELGGQASLESQPGQGTKVVLSLPLTLVTTQVVLVRVGQAIFALPASACQGTLWVHRSDLRALEGQPTIEYGERTVAVMALGDLLGVETERPLAAEDRAPALLVGGAQRPVALVVDGLLDEREAVVKPLGALLANQRRFGGAVQLGDGSLVLLLNPLLLTQGARPATVVSRPVTVHRRLLVADDSFATRELIRSILESAGFGVTVAVDGQDALERLRAESFDLVVSDVEMPRLTGLQLVASMRAEQALRPVPAVLITSLGAEEDRRRGIEAGAQAYIVKSQFNQESLLDVVRQLLR